ncbi:peptidylprolyl isomerase [Candidatus Wolfebacteria bacterium]|nr:peptidylprolyl isomerase [Candidatus Wolfebacteria bacterium]
MENDVQAQLPRAVLKTSKGTIELELFEGEAPETVGNFIALAEDGFYDGTRFHRVIPNFMIQGGDPLSKDDDQKELWGTGGPGYMFSDEFTEELSNVRGTIAMANAGPDTNGSQFFINIVDNTFLDGKHAVFGRVVDGMEIVDAIVGVPTEGPDRPVDDIVLEKVTIER